MSSVRLVNCFEAPIGRDEDFLGLWREVNAYISDKPGYLGHRLHRSLAVDAQYRFVNYVEWSSAQESAAAHDDGFRALVGKPGWREFTSTKALYEICDEKSL